MQVLEKPKLTLTIRKGSFLVLYSLDEGLFREENILLKSLASIVYQGSEG